MNHAHQTQAGGFVFDRQKIVITFTKGGSDLEGNLAALRLHAQRAGFQRLEIRTADEIGVAYPDFRIKRAFLARHEAVSRERLKAFGDFRAEFQRRVGDAGQCAFIQTAVKDHSADDLVWVLEKVIIDDGLA